MTIPSDKSDPIFGNQPIKPGTTTPQAPGADFQSFSTAAQQAPPKGFQAQAPSAIPGAQYAVQTAGPSLDSLISQIGISQDSLANVRNQLGTKDLQFRRSQQHLLRNKLSDATTHLRAANAKLGVETPPMPSQSGAKPIERFLGYVTDGENQLAAAQQQIENISKKGIQMNAGDFLLVQVKLSQAQQEIEYSSSLLGKVVDSLKQILNTQL
ncbi:MAG: hypothetical protein HW387_794 [Parachlamydiales bacterium]|nr:hypothetical protein [Parachlamydiales bacterium]